MAVNIGIGKGGYVVAGSSDSGFASSGGAVEVGGLSSEDLIFNTVTSNLDANAFPKTMINGTNFIFLGGSGFGDIAVGGIALSGYECGVEAGGGAGLFPGLELARQFYANNNVTTTAGGTVSVSIGSSAFKMYMTGFAIQGADPQVDVVSFQLIGFVANPSRS